GRRRRGSARPVIAADGLGKQRDLVDELVDFDGPLERASGCPGGAELGGPGRIAHTDELGRAAGELAHTLYGVECTRLVDIDDEYAGRFADDARLEEAERHVEHQEPARAQGRGDRFAFRRRIGDEYDVPFGALRLGAVPALIGIVEVALGLGHA